MASGGNGVTLNLSLQELKILSWYGCSRLEDYKKEVEFWKDIRDEELKYYNTVGNNDNDGNTIQKEDVLDEEIVQAMLYVNLCEDEVEIATAKKLGKQLDLISSGFNPDDFNMDLIELEFEEAEADLKMAEVKLKRAKYKLEDVELGVKVKKEMDALEINDNTEEKGVKV